MKKWYILSVCVLVGGIIIALFIFLSWPSQEMKVLYSIEESLNIPKSDRRMVDDAGCYHDWKNAQQYDRDIYYSYGYKKNLPLSFVQMLLDDDQWDVKVLSFDTSNLQGPEGSTFMRWSQDTDITLEEFITQHNLVEDRDVRSLLKSSRIPLKSISFQNKQKNACLYISLFNIFIKNKNFQNAGPDHMSLSDCLGREICY
jgi:hypothetical protein